MKGSILLLNNVGTQHDSCKFSPLWLSLLSSSLSAADRSLLLNQSVEHDWIQKFVRIACVSMFSVPFTLITCLYIYDGCFMVTLKTASVKGCKKNVKMPSFSFSSNTAFDSIQLVPSRRKLNTVAIINLISSLQELIESK